MKQKHKFMVDGDKVEEVASMFIARYVLRQYPNQRQEHAFAAAAMSVMKWP